jgi:uncharacterized protein YegL
MQRMLVAAWKHTDALIETIPTVTSAEYRVTAGTETFTGLSAQRALHDALDDRLISSDYLVGAATPGECRFYHLTRAGRKFVEKCQPTVTTVRVAIVLDESGSMAVGADETIAAFNEQVQALKQAYEQDGITTYVSLYTFDTTVEAKRRDIDVTQFAELTATEYTPKGLTAMYDAVGQAITHLLAVDTPQTSTLVVIISDGRENASREFTAQDIANLIVKQQATKRWTFTYMGANQDLSTVAETLKIPRGNMMQFDASSAYTYSNAYAAHAQATLNFRAALSAQGLGAESTATFYGSTDIADATQDDSPISHGK